MNAPHSLAVSGLTRVQVSLPVAGIGYRTLAWLLDALLLFFGGAVAYFVLSLLVSDMLGLLQGFSSLVRVLLTVGVFAALWIYWTALETLWRGQTLGKRLVGIRVVRLDGSPVGLYESAVRNLLRFVDFLPALYGFGVLSMLLTDQHRRLGDLVAGTVLVREEQVSLDKYLAPAAAEPIRAARPAQGDGPLPSAPPVSAPELELVLQYLDRSRRFTPEARERLALALLGRFAEALPPEERARIAQSAEQTERTLRVRVSGISA